MLNRRFGRTAFVSLPSTFIGASIAAKGHLLSIQQETVVAGAEAP